MKLSKQDTRIFEIEMNNLYVTDKSKIFMVGDILTSDIQGGVNYGIDTCWFNPLGSENKTSIKPTYEIDRLAKLKDIIL